MAINAAVLKSTSYSNIPWCHASVLCHASASVKHRHHGGIISFMTHDIVAAEEMRLLTMNIDLASFSLMDSR